MFKLKLILTYNFTSWGARSGTVWSVISSVIEIGN